MTEKDKGSKPLNESFKPDVEKSIHTKRPHVEEKGTYKPSTSEAKPRTPPPPPRNKR